MLRYRPVLWVAALSVVLAISFSTPRRADASPRDKTYSARLTILILPEVPIPTCLVFDGDGSFAFDFTYVRIPGGWFEVGGLWFASALELTTVQSLFLFIGTTLGSNAEILVSGGLIVPLFPGPTPLPFVVGGYRTQSCPEIEQTDDALQRR